MLLGIGHKPIPFTIEETRINSGSAPCTGNGLQLVLYKGHIKHYY